MSAAKVKIKTREALIVFDCETTGLPLHPSADLKKQPRIIEFGALLIDGATGEELKTFCQFINPEQPISPEITKITGITNSDVEGAHTFEEILPQLVDLFGGATAMCAHNLPFDKIMLINELKRVGCNTFPWPKKNLCTISLYAPEYGRMPKLKELYADKMGKPLAQTHRALDDARALAEIVKAEKLHAL